MCAAVLVALFLGRKADRGWLTSRLMLLVETFLWRNYGLVTWPSPETLTTKQAKGPAGTSCTRDNNHTATFLPLHPPKTIFESMLRRIFAANT